MDRRGMLLNKSGGENQVEGSIVELARRVGMERTHLYRKLRSLGIDPKKVVGET